MVKCCQQVGKVLSHAVFLVCITSLLSRYLCLKILWKDKGCLVSVKNYRSKPSQLSILFDVIAKTLNFFCNLAKCLFCSMKILL